MRDFKKRILAGAAVLAAIAALAVSGSAQAAFQVRLTDVGTGMTTGPINVTNLGTINVTIGNFTVSGVTTITNDPGASTGAFISIDNAAVVNHSGGADTLKVEETANNFTAPTGPGLELLSNAVGQVTAGTLDGGNFTSYVGANNGLFAEPGAGGVTSPTETFGPTTAVSGFGTLTPSQTGPFTLSGSYSITNLGNYTLEGGSILTGTLGDSQVVVPAPGGAVLALAALPFVGFGLWLRRRNTALAVS